MNEVKDFLEDEIKDEFDTLQNLERGGEEHSRAVDDICKMVKTLAELEKIEKDKDKDEIRKEVEDRLRVSENKFNRIMGLLTLGLNIGNTAYGYRFDNRWMRDTLLFEKEGIIRSNKPLFVFKPRRKK